MFLELSIFNVWQTELFVPGFTDQIELMLFLFIQLSYLLLAVLGLHYCTGFSLVVDGGGYCLAAVLGLLVVTPLVVGQRFQGMQASVVTAHKLGCCDSQALEHWFNSCGAWTSLLLGVWDLPRPRQNQCLLH